MAFIILKVYQHVYNIHLKGTMSQNFKIGPSFLFMSKNGKIFLLFFHNYFSRFHKIKSRTYIKNLRHGSLQMNVLCGYVKFHAWGMINKGDILVQKIKVKKSFFIFPDPPSHCLFTNVYMNNIS